MSQWEKTRGQIEKKMKRGMRRAGKWQRGRKIRRGKRSWAKREKKRGIKWESREESE